MYTPGALGNMCSPRDATEEEIADLAVQLSLGLLGRLSDLIIPYATVNTIDSRATLSVDRVSI